MSKLEDMTNAFKGTNNPADVDSDLKEAANLAKENLAQSTGGEKLKSVLDRLTPKGNTVAASQPAEDRAAFQPDIRVTQNRAGFSSQQIKDQFNPDVQITPSPSTTEQSAPKVRPATAFDLSSITEADVLNLPFIDAKSFDVPAMLQVKPKDGSLRFRWVNYRNYEGGNYAMFKAIGFTNATPEDVEGGVSDNLLKEDGTVKWFDVILMKVDVLRLMGIYKKNIIRSLEQVGRWQPQAVAQAKRTLENEVGSDVLQAMRKAGHNVEFYAPSTSEMAAQDRDFAEGK